MRMRVNQSGEYSGIWKIDAQSIGGDCGARAASHAHDFAVLDDDRLIGKQLTGLHVEHVSSVDDNAFRILLSDELHRKRKQYDNNPDRILESLHEVSITFCGKLYLDRYDETSLRYAQERSGHGNIRSWP
jgi:hypothetical protein